MAVICIAHIILSSEYKVLITIFSIMIYFLLWKIYVTIDRNDKLIGLELAIKINTIEKIKTDYPILKEEIIQIKSPKAGYITFKFKEVNELYKIIYDKNEKGTLL